MAKITYLLGAGASYYACPILEKQAEKMIDVANHILSDRKPFDDEKQNGISHSFKIDEFRKIPIDNKFQIAWYIGYFGKKAMEYNTIDTYARKLNLNGELKELRLLKMCVSVFFDLWENFYHAGFGFLSSSDYIKIDNRYKSLFSVLLNNEKGVIKLNDDFKFITWNYDLQLEETFGMFLGENNTSDLNAINKSFKFKENQSDEIDNNVFHLNGHRGFFNNVSTKSNNEELIINISNNLDSYWKNISDLFESTEKGIANFDNYIKYAWEHDPNSVFLEKILNVICQTDVLIIIGYSFPPFNRKIDQLLFNKIHPNKIKKIIYQDPNASKEIIKNLFINPENYNNIIEVVDDERSLKQFYLPNEYFIDQVEKSNVTRFRV